KLVTGVQTCALPISGSLVVYLSTQDPHGARDELAELLSMDTENVRVVAPEVGGAFGGKAGVYPEDPVISYAAMALRRPVKWVEKIGRASCREGGWRV